MAANEPTDQSLAPETEEPNHATAVMTLSIKVGSAPADFQTIQVGDEHASVIIQRGMNSYHIQMMKDGSINTWGMVGGRARATQVIFGE